MVMLNVNSNITKREFEIVNALSHGMNSEEISEKLFISIFTVQTHRKNILQKVSAKNTAHLVRIFFDQGLNTNFKPI